MDDAAHCSRPRGITQRAWQQAIGEKEDVLQNGLWSDGNLVNGNSSADGSKLNLNNGNVDNRNPDNGVREKFRASIRLWRILRLQILDPAVRHFRSFNKQGFDADISLLIDDLQFMFGADEVLCDLKQGAGFFKRFRFFQFRGERGRDDAFHRFKHDPFDFFMNAKLVAFWQLVSHLINGRVYLLDTMNDGNIIFRDGTGRDGTGRDGTGRDGNSIVIFHTIASVANLLSAWNEFKRGKRKKKDIAQFELHLEDNIFALHESLVSKKYRHDPYEAFYVCDPKRRHIHKASVRDRVLHQAIFRVLYPIFDKHFIYDSYSSRIGKGTHAGVARLRDACRKVTANWRKPAYTLKCDVRKFFDSIDHAMLRKLIVQKVSDPDVLWLIDLVFESFEKGNHPSQRTPGRVRSRCPFLITKHPSLVKEGKKGLPLGNVTSQLFANIYLNELDQYAKHVLKTRHYFRYCDDFVIVHADRAFLERATVSIRNFLHDALSLELHPHKVEIRKARQGIDFLGYVGVPHATLLRTKTEKRIVRKIAQARIDLHAGKIDQGRFQGMIASYLGVISHCRAKETEARIRRWG